MNDEMEPDEFSIPACITWLDNKYARHRELEDRFSAKHLRDYQSAIRTLQDIAAMGRKAGSESAKHRLAQLGIPLECASENGEK